MTIGKQNSAWLEAHAEFFFSLPSIYDAAIRTVEELTV